MQFAPGSVQQVVHCHVPPVGRSQIGCADNDIADIAARQFEAAGKERQIDVRRLGQVHREEGLPDAHPVVFVGEGEIHNELHPPGKGFVHIGAQIGSQNRHPVVLLHPLQQIADFHIGVAVVGILHFRALAEDGIGFVEEEDGAAALGFVEDAPQIFFRLANKLAHNRREVQFVEVQPQIAGDDLGGHCLARAGRASEENGDPGAGLELAPHTPLLHHHTPALDHLHQLLQHRFLVAGHNQIVPVIAGFDLLGQTRKVWAGMGTGGGNQVPALDDILALQSRVSGCGYRVLYLAAGQDKLAGDGLDIRVFGHRKVDVSQVVLPKSQALAVGRLCQRNAHHRIGALDAVAVPHLFAADNQWAVRPKEQLHQIGRRWASGQADIPALDKKHRSGQPGVTNGGCQGFAVGHACAHGHLNVKGHQRETGGSGQQPGSGSLDTHIRSVEKGQRLTIEGLENRLPAFGCQQAILICGFGGIEFDELLQTGIRLVLTQQPGHHTFVCDQLAGEQRAGIVFLAGHAHQPVVDQPVVLQKGGQKPQTFVEIAHQHLQNHTDCGSAQGDIVLNIAEYPFVAQIEGRGQTDEKSVVLEGAEFEGIGQLEQTRCKPLLVSGLHGSLYRCLGLKVEVAKSGECLVAVARRLFAKEMADLAGGYDQPYHLLIPVAGGVNIGDHLLQKHIHTRQIRMEVVMAVFQFDFGCDRDNSHYETALWFGSNE